MFGVGGEGGGAAVEAVGAGATDHDGREAGSAWSGEAVHGEDEED